MLIGELILQRQKNWCLLCLLCIGLVGCSWFTEMNRNHKFETRERLFSQAIRWSEFERAQEFIRTRNNRPQNPDFAYLNQIKVTKYQNTNIAPQENFDEQNLDIILVYEIDYFVKDSYKMKHQRYKQLWWYDESVENWFLDTDLPKFRR